MASSLGNAFGVAMSSTIYGFGASFMNLQLGGLLAYYSMPELL